MIQLILKDKKNKLIRFFNCETNHIYLVYRKNKKRLDFCSSPNFFNKEPILLVDEFKVDEVQSRPVPGMDAVIELCPSSGPMQAIVSDFKLPVEKDFFQRFFAGTVFLYALTAFFIYNFQSTDQSQKREIAKQHIVELKKPPTAVQVKQVKFSNQRGLNPKSRTTASQNKKSLKQMGALAVLAGLSESETLQKGGLNLTSATVSQGPGFKALSSGAEGSGGVQSQVYSKGMISSALGSGGNIQGGGGHGTKGTQKGGGSSGYGSLSLIGSGGDSNLSQSSEFSSVGEGFDYNLINREFLKKYALFRGCYIEGLKNEPNLEGLFEFYFQVNKKGQVIKSWLNPSSPVQSVFISNCILKIVNQVKFPIQMEVVTQFTYSFDLSELEN